MPNHVEIEGSGLDDLLLSNDTTAESVESNSTETVSAEVADVSPLMESSDQTETSESTNDVDTSDVLMSFLSEYGIKDGKVTYENEDGSTEEKNFNDLDSEEKLSILKELTTPNLSKDEIEVINYLRSNNATIQDVITYYSQKAVEDYIKENGPIEKQYAIDDYSDDELYIADLKSKFADMTEEDLKADLESAKENDSLFKKKVDSIRKQYKAQEENAAKEKVKEQEEQFNNFKNSIESSLNEFNEISMDYKDNKSDQLQIEDSEKEEIFKYILDQDENGTTQFFRDLNDAKKLVKIAWLARYGEEAISNITNYWKSQLKNSRRSDSKTQTVVVPADKKTEKDNFMNHHKFVETSYGENLL